MIDALSPLRYFPQWINYRLVPRPDGKTDKLPVDPHTGQVCNAHDPTVHTDYETAAAAGPVAFVFTEADPFFFVDVDNCLVDGQWTPAAIDLCTRFAGCAIEVSQSGKGLHIFGVIPEIIPHGCDCKELGTQFYTSGRFVAITGTNLTGSAAFVPSVEVYREFIQTHFTPTVSPIPENWTTTECPEWSGPEDDDILVAKMLKSKSVKSIVGTGVTFAQLWNSDSDSLSLAYPHPDGGFDQSVADAALCSHLAFWTGKNCERMERLWGMSALGKRDKFHDREDYRHRTILRAVGLCGKVYKAPVPVVIPEPGTVPLDPSPEDGLRVGYQYLTPMEQPEVFRGCVYVQDQHKIFTPRGDLLRSDQFRAAYGGFTYAMDSIGKKTSVNAWEVFTESQALKFPAVASTCFRPELPPGHIVLIDDRPCVNTYVPVSTACTAGDPGPFLDLLRRLLPSEQDREILLAYMAACVQHVGVKFQWAPVIQGIQGNGKSFLGACLTHAMGERYTHIADPKDIGNIFNAWICNKTLVIIEEIYTRDRTDVIETLKLMITNPRVPVQSKGSNQTTGDNRANFFMCSNAKDGVIKTITDRRFCPFYTAQQEMGDMKRDGLDGSYFPELYRWARGGGFAVVNHYFHEYQIPEQLNPAGSCHRAPITTSTYEAINHSMSSTEQRILEACEEGLPGFSGGWISSMAVDKLLHGKFSVQKISEMLKNMGYERHPGLNGGRVNNPILFEGGKPRLYIPKGHILRNLTGAAEISRKYCEAQGYVIQTASTALKA